MKAKTKVFGGRLEVEVEGNTEKELFRELAQVEEIFGVSKNGVVDQCGCCKGRDLKFRVRKVDDPKKKGKFFEYFELQCKKCYGRIAFGQMQEGDKLFPKKNEDGSYWAKYVKEQTNEQSDQ